MQSLALLSLRAPVAGAACRPTRSAPAVQAAAGVSTSRAARREQAASRRHRLAVQAAAAAQADPVAAEEVSELKAALIDSFWGTDRGLAASSDSRAEINELITQLEARNPTPEPNEARQKLGGAWRLAYTSNSELIALLALDRLPLVTVGDITQTIDPLSMTVENTVQVSAPLSKTSLTAVASFEVRSPKLLQVSFEESRVATPQLLADVPLPTSLELLGQQVDLTPLQSALAPVEGPLRSALQQLGGLLAQVPDLRVPIPAQVNASSWLLNTYLDDSMRITRGDGGSVFVLLREEFSSTDPYSYASTTTDTTTTTTSASTSPAMSNSDWEAIEEQDPPGSSTAASSAAASATVAAAAQDAAAATPTVVVVEPSDVIESGSSSNGNGNGL